MSAKQIDQAEKIVELLQYLLVIELWRSGLSQQQIRAQLGISINAVNNMLKGVKRGIKQDQDE